MKIKLYMLALLALVLLIPACKDDDNPADPGGDTPGDTENYFPGGTGTFYRFDIVVQDSLGVSESGQRTSTYLGNVDRSGTTYTEQRDSIFLVSENTSSSAYFRKSGSGLFYYLDTTGLSAIVDTFIQYVTFDTEVRGLKFPLAAGDTWPVFKLDLNYLINLRLVEVTAAAEGVENITLNLATGQETKEALRIKYLLTLRLPDPDNLLSVITSTYEARGWIIKNIGFARWQGSAAVIGFFAGSEINLGDSTTTVTQDLIQYTIR
jgi:hypothetical protein